jgi:flavin reductase (DIM6/NTAB) family NADH-FMN oxidoreductase RutF
MSVDKNVLAVLKRFEYGIYIVTMGKGEAGNAFTASWVAQVSSEPPMIAVAIHNKHQSARILNDEQAFLINLIPAEGEAVARTYYGPAESGYEKLKTSNISNSPVTGNPVISGAAGYVECKIVYRVATGNHTIFIGEVVGGNSVSEGGILTSSNCKLRYLG